MLGLILLVDVAGLAAGAWFLWRPRRDPPTAAAALLDLLVFAGALGVGAALLTRITTGDMFAVLRIGCHVLFCVLAPLMIARGVWLLRARGAGGVRVLAAVLVTAGLLAEAVYLYARRVEPYRLQVNRYSVESPRLSGLDRPLKVVVLSDLQTDRVGDYEVEVFRQLDAERADLIVMPGDFLQLPTSDPRYPDERRRLLGLFASLEHAPPLGLFAVDGDIDVSSVSLSGSPVRVLTNQVVELPGAPLQLVGLSVGASRAPLAADLLDDVSRFAGYSIVVGHAPEFMLDAIEERDRPECLMVAGHTHGGQVAVPFFGPPITLSGVPRRYAAGGLFRLGPSTLCISRGIGMERSRAPRIRLFCPPELIVIELRPPSAR